MSKLEMAHEALKEAQRFLYEHEDEELHQSPSGKTGIEVLSNLTFIDHDTGLEWERRLLVSSVKAIESSVLHRLPTVKELLSLTTYFEVNGRTTPSQTIFRDEVAPLLIPYEITKYNGRTGVKHSYWTATPDWLTGGRRRKIFYARGILSSYPMVKTDGSDVLLPCLLVVKN